MPEFNSEVWELEGISDPVFLGFMSFFCGRRYLTLMANGFSVYSFDFFASMTGHRLLRVGEPALLAPSTFRASLRFAVWTVLGMLSELCSVGTEMSRFSCLSLIESSRGPSLAASCVLVLGLTSESVSAWLLKVTVIHVLVTGRLIGDISVKSLWLRSDSSKSKKVRKLYELRAKFYGPRFKFVSIYTDPEYLYFRLGMKQYLNCKVEVFF